MNTTQLRGLPVPLPPLALQRDFATQVAEARALQDQQARSRSRLEEARPRWRLHREELNRPRLSHEDWEN